MKDFIHLTTEQGKGCIIPLDQVSLIREKWFEKPGHTEISLKHSASICVKETTQEIVDIIGGMK